MMLSISNTQMQILRESCKYSADFNVVLENIFDSGSVLKRFNGKVRRQCLLAFTLANLSSTKMISDCVTCLIEI